MSWAESVVRDVSVLKFLVQFSYLIHEIFYCFLEGINFGHQRSTDSVDGCRLNVHHVVRKFSKF